MVPVAGIDVSKYFSDMCILSPDNSVSQRVKIYHDLTSMQRSLLALQEAQQQFGSKPVLVMESTSHYHRLLWQFMDEAGYEVLVINPIQSNGLKNINVRKIKNDKVDAYKIAMLYRLKMLRPSNIPGRSAAALRALSRQHQEIKQDITRYTNRLTAILDQTFPGYEKIFCKTNGNGSLAVLEHYPVPQDVLAAPDEELMCLLMKACNKGPGFARDKMEKLRQTAKQAVWLGIRQYSDALLVQSFVKTIRLMQENVEAIDSEMRAIVETDTLLKTNVELLQTIPGIGEFSAMVLMAEMGDFCAFQKPKQLAAYFGLDPSERQSGQFSGTQNKISKRGSRYVRSVLNMAVHNCIYSRNGREPSNPVLADYFEKKRLSKPHKVAMVAVMHKMVNIVFAVLRDQKPFELRAPEEHDKRLKQKNSFLAA